MQTHIQHVKLPQSLIESINLYQDVLLIFLQTVNQTFTLDTTFITFLSNVILEMDAEASSK